MLRRNAAQLEECRDEMRRELLSERGDSVEAARRRVTEHGERLGQARQLVEARAHLRRHFGRFAGGAKEFFALLEMAVPKRLYPAQRADEMTLRRLLSDRQQRIRRSGKGRHDDRGLSIEAAFDDFGGALNRLRIADRCPAKLYDDHAESRAPLEASSSAFSTDPPAAPRTVL